MFFGSKLLQMIDRSRTICIKTIANSLQEFYREPIYRLLRAWKISQSQNVVNIYLSLHTDKL